MARPRGFSFALAGLPLIVILVALLSMRKISTTDIGYHLAYGETFFNTARIVDSSPFIYTIERADDSLADPGPGNWYSEDGQYSFVNGSWLSQALLFAAFSLGGELGLALLQVIAVCAIFGFLLWALLRCSIPLPWVVAALGVLAMASYERLVLRPELFTSVTLAAAIAVVLPVLDDPERRQLSWRSVGLLVLLQLLAVNLHAYFLISLGLTATVLISSALRARAARSGRAETLRKNTTRAACALFGQTVACFVNPWGWRLAVMPVLTLSYLRAHGIVGAGASSHPWSRIGEFMEPFGQPFFRETLATYAYLTLLLVAGAASLVSLWKRRWGLTLTLAGGIAVGLSMRRNLAISGLLLVPLSLVILKRPLIKRLQLESSRPRWRAVVALAASLPAMFGIIAILSGHFYVGAQSEWCVGMGLSRFALPLEAADWLNRQQPKGTLWTDFNSSSNAHFFVTPHPPVPCLTNTWAQPAEQMAENIQYSRGEKPFEEAVDAYSVEIVLLQSCDLSAPLIRKLASDPAWALVSLEPRYLLFLRRNGPNSELALRSAIGEDSFDPRGFQQALTELDAPRESVFFSGGMTLFRLGWYAAASHVFRGLLRDDDQHSLAWNMLGSCLGFTGTRALLNENAGGKDELLEARRCFRRAIFLEAGDTAARKNLEYVNRQIAALRRGMLLVPAELAKDTP